MGKEGRKGKGGEDGERRKEGKRTGVRVWKVGVGRKRRKKEKTGEGKQCRVLKEEQVLGAKKQFRGDAYEGDGDIPQVLGQALDLFEEAEGLHAVLGAEFARVYSIVKRAEYEEFLQVISPWEREHLLLNV